MAEENVSGAVSGATEAGTSETSGESSSTSTQAGDTQATTTSSEPAPKQDWRTVHRSDPTLNDYIQSQIMRTLDRAEQRRLRDEAKVASESKDPARLADIANRVATQVDPEDAEQTAFMEKARKADSTIQRLTGTDEYAQLWKEHGKPAMDAKWLEDPEGFAGWVEDQVLDLRATNRAKKIAQELAKAMSTEQTNEALKNLPTPVVGGASGSGSLSYDQYLAMNPRDRIKLKKENPQLVDAMVARAAR